MTAIYPHSDFSRGCQPTLKCTNYSAGSRKGQQSMWMESNEALCNIAIAQIIHSLDLPLPLPWPFICAVLKTARTVRRKYGPRNRQHIGGTLLNANYNNVCNLNKKKLLDNSNITGLQAIGDGATIRKIPLFNVLASTHDAAPIVLAVHDYSKYLALGCNIDIKCVARIFIPQMLKLDSKKNKFNLYIVDGASNVQSAGDVLAAYFPCVTTIHGSEHGTCLDFTDITKLSSMKVSSFCLLLLDLSLHRELIIIVTPFETESYFLC